jgi:hypothetical protein
MTPQEERHSTHKEESYDAPIHTVNDAPDDEPDNAPVHTVKVCYSGESLV